jgi:tetratricopeptide (TPR) repeat protein
VIDLIKGTVANPDLLFLRIKALFKLQEFELASQELHKCLLHMSTNEHLFTAYYLKGKFCYSLQDFKAALINLNNA